MKYMVIALMMCGGDAIAGSSGARNTATYKLVDSGKDVSVIEAVTASVSGARVIKCEEVEAKATKSGTITLHKRKAQ